MFIALQQKSSPSVLLSQYIYLRLPCSYSLWIFIIFLQTFFKFIKSDSTCRKIHFHTKLWCCNFITKDLSNPENLVQHRISVKNYGRIPCSLFINFITFFAYLFILLYINVFNSILVFISIHWSIFQPVLSSSIFLCFFLFEFLWAFIKK